MTVGIAYNRKIMRRENRANLLVTSSRISAMASEMSHLGSG